MYYKAVRRVDERLLSVCENTNFPKEFIVEYFPDKRVEAVVKGTPLFIFEHLRDAINFVSVFTSDVEIWECEAENVRATDVVVRVSEVDIFWEKVKQNIPYTISDGYWSNYLIFKDSGLRIRLQKLSCRVLNCDSLTLTKKVWDSTDVFSQGK